MMIQNALFRQCLAAIPEGQKAEIELKFGIAERISEVLKAKNVFDKPNVQSQVSLSYAMARKHLLKTNLTQKDFAQKLHKRELEISKWLTGRHNFTMQTIAKIETALSFPMVICP